MALYSTYVKKVLLPLFDTTRSDLTPPPPPPPGPQPCERFNMALDALHDDLGDDHDGAACDRVRRVQQRGQERALLPALFLGHHDGLGLVWIPHQPRVLCLDQVRPVPSCSPFNMLQARIPVDNSHFKLRQERLASSSWHHLLPEQSHGRQHPGHLPHSPRICHVTLCSSRASSH